MSSTDLTKFPDGPNIGGQPQRGGELTSPLKAQIIGVPNEARGASATVRIAGEVIRADDQGNIRIKTQSGTIDVQLAKAEGKAQQALQKGQFVEINIPPERPESKSRDNTQTANAAERSAAREVKISIRRAPPAQSQDVQNQSTPRTQEAAARDSASRTEQAQPPPQSKDYPQAKLPSAPVRMEQLPQEMIKQIIVPQQQKLDVKLQAITAHISSEQAQALQSLLTPSAQGAMPIPAYSQPVQTMLEPPPSQLTQQGAAQIMPVLAQNGAERSILTQPPALGSQGVILSAPSASTASAATSIDTNIFQGSIGASFITQGEGVPQLTLQSTLTIAMPNIGVKMQNQIAFRDTALSQQGFSPLPLIPSQSIQSAFLSDITAPPVHFTAPDDKGLQASAPFNIDAPKIPPGIQAGETRAIFSGLTPDKLPVVSFPAGINLAASNLAEMQNFILHYPLPGDIPIGAELTLQTLSSGSTITQSSMTPSAQMISTNSHALSYALPPLPAYFQSPESWPVMNDILQTLQAQSVQGTKAMSALTPSPASTPAQIGPAALFFLAAVKVGDLQSWLGEKAIETLRKAGRGDILSRLGSESSTLSRMSREASPGEWRGLSIPFMAEHDIQKVAFYYKHDYPDDNGGDDDKGEKRTRFIFDMSLSNMGMVQLDGMHKGKKLDMVLRTQESFSPAARAAMKQIYIQSLELTDLHGELSFHNRPEQWVKVPLKNEGAEVSA